MLEQLEKPAGTRGGGWRLAAAAFALLLLAVIAAGRLGMADGPELAASPSPERAAEATASHARTPPAPTPTEPAQPDSAPRPLPPPDVEVLPDLPRHLDGIPTSMGGEKVFRVSSALLRGDQHMLLVGGWYLGPDCLRVGRCVGRLADSPAAALRSQQSVALEGVLDPQSGPRVVRAVVRETCRAETSAPCLPALTVLETVWTGDFFTRSAPIAAQPLLGALSYAFPEMHAEPFRDFARCPVAWPPQTYRSVRGGPRMTLVFPSTQDRTAAERAIRAGWPLPEPGVPGQCTDHFMSVSGAGDWLAQDNVMLWVEQDEGVLALARAALQDARTQSGPASEPVPGPLTTWAALKALHRWETGIDLLAPQDHEVWGSDLPEEAYALSDPYVRVLLVFPSRAERRAYQQGVPADEVIVLHGVRATQRSVGSGMLEARGSEVRWLGVANVLLQVTGPERFDERLREVLAEILD